MKYSFNELSCQENLSRSTLTYLLKLIDKYGAKILDQPNKKYSKEFKEAAIARVLKHQESGIQISLELGLRSRGMLVNWVREYKENGYNVVIRKKGRPSF
jgi:putative transposase